MLSVRTAICAPLVLTYTSPQPLCDENKPLCDENNDAVCRSVPLYEPPWQVFALGISDPCATPRRSGVFLPRTHPITTGGSA
jgi:hypothetical protein